MSLDLFTQDVPNRIHVKVTPKAKHESIKIITYGDDCSIPSYKVHVKAPPEDGKANKAVIDLIAKQFNVEKSKISITNGYTSRDKYITIKKDSI